MEAINKHIKTAYESKILNNLITNVGVTEFEVSGKHYVGLAIEVEHNRPLTSVTRRALNTYCDIMTKLIDENIDYPVYGKHLAWKMDEETDDDDEEDFLDEEEEIIERLEGHIATVDKLCEQMSALKSDVTKNSVRSETNQCHIDILKDQITTKGENKC